MRSYLLIAALCSSTAVAARDGQMGAMSSGTIAIRASVAPRAWQIAPDDDPLRICVATGGAFTPIDTKTGANLSWQPSIGSCPFGGQQLKILSVSTSGTESVVIRPE